MDAHVRVSITIVKSRFSFKAIRYLVSPLAGAQDKSFVEVAVVKTQLQTIRAASSGLILIDSSLPLPPLSRIAVL